MALGLALAAIQLLPMAQAAAQSPRSVDTESRFLVPPSFALIETVAFHLFGNFYTSQSLASLPWMPLLNGGREPFFYSVYFGVPLLTLALFGVVAGGHRRWVIFWIAAAAVGVTCAFGAATPVYPFLRDHLPLLRSFRFPVKYLVVCSVTVAAATAAGWDAIRGDDAAVDGARLKHARAVAIIFVACGRHRGVRGGWRPFAFPRPTVFRFYDLRVRCRHHELPMPPNSC